MFKIDRRLQDIRGFSLLELTMVMMISGLLLAVGAKFLEVYTINQKHIVTTENIDVTQSALREFYGLTGRYPCPADPTLQPNDANYGRQRCRTLVTNDCTTGVPANISCTRNGSRDADSDGADDVIMIGVLPYKDIMETIEGTDYFKSNADAGGNMHFTYAVSEKMTRNIYNAANPASYYLGAIRIVDENQVDVLDPPGPAHYALVSHGENQEGGYAQSGTRISPCLTGLQTDPNLDAPPTPGLNAAGIAPEKENCDGNDAIFITSFRSIGISSDYYDDMIAYASMGLESHWEMSALSNEDRIFNTNFGNVGVGEDDPNEKLHVASTIAAQRSVAGRRYCNDGPDNDADGDDEGAQNCLNPNAIAGTGSSCPNGQVAFGIENNRLLCRPLFLAIPAVNCPPGQFLVGVSNIGNVRCAVLPVAVPIP